MTARSDKIPAGGQAKTSEDGRFSTGWIRRRPARPRDPTSALGIVEAAVFLDETLKDLSGVALTPDRLGLLPAGGAGRRIRFRVRSDGLAATDPSLEWPWPAPEIVLLRVEAGTTRPSDWCALVSGTARPCGSENGLGWLNTPHVDWKDGDASLALALMCGEERGEGERFGLRARLCSLAVRACGEAGSLLAGDRKTVAVGGCPEELRGLVRHLLRPGFGEVRAYVAGGGYGSGFVQVPRRLRFFCGSSHERLEALRELEAAAGDGALNDAESAFVESALRLAAGPAAG